MIHLYNLAFSVFCNHPMRAVFWVNYTNPWRSLCDNFIQSCCSSSEIMINSHYFIFSFSILTWFQDLNILFLQGSALVPSCWLFSELWRSLFFSDIVFSVMGWVLECGKFAFYIAFPVGLFYYFNHPTIYEFFVSFHFQVYRLWLVWLLWTF